MAKDKVHYFTNESYTNPNSDKVWYHSGCRLIAAGAPTENISQVTCERCKSYLQKNHPRYQHQHYSGVLELYFETGMECMGTIFHDNRGLHEGVDYADPTKKRMYHNLEHTIWFGNKMGIYTIRVFDKQDKIVYEGPLKKDKYAIARHKYAYSFLPQEVPARDWVEWCRQEYRAELYTNELTSAFRKGKTEYDIGEIVEDSVTGKDVVIHNMTLKSDSVAYWVSDDVRDGYRLDSEIKKIDWQARWNRDREALKAKNEQTD